MLVESLLTVLTEDYARHNFSQAPKRDPRILTKSYKPRGRLALFIRSP